MDSLIDILRNVGATLGVVSTIWLFWKAYRDRTRLAVDAYWDSTDEDGTFPEITVRNVGGRTVYVEGIALVEADGSHHWVGSFDNKEIKADQKFSCRPVWSDESFDESPEFRHGWKGLRACVRDTRGKKWWSASPTSEPKWFYLSPPPDLDDWAVTPALPGPATGQ